jgi:hypothetical protein
MFELLLQADRAVSEGLLDQAERTYWQLVELEPTNAIAVVGLARVSLERGDERMARMFADRARAMDPENLAARRIIEALERRIPGDVAAEAPDLPLIAAQRLGALSRRRNAGPDRPEEGAGTVAAASAGPSTAATAGGARGVASGGRHDVTAEAATGEAAGRGRRKRKDEEAGAATASQAPRRPAAKPAKAAQSAPADHAAASGGAIGSSRGPRFRLRPDPIPQLPSEPLTERRRAGRLAAAAAAAAAAAMQQSAHLPRHEPHHAMPSRPGRVDAEELRAPAQDPYAAAEAAAVVEAVDAVDLVDEAPASTPGPSADAAAALGAEAPSEEDAETQALSEAQAIVLGSEREAGQAASTGQLAAMAGAGDTASPAEPAEPAQAAPDAPAASRKKSFFDRLRGG